MDLFQTANFKSHAGLDLTWKIEMDALSSTEWVTIKNMIMERAQPFRKAIGIPRGGVLLADLMDLHSTNNENDPICIVDDVLTTGTSFTDFVIDNSLLPRDYIGWCVFARAEPPAYVTALFQMPAIYNLKQFNEDTYQYIYTNSGC